MDIIKKKVIEKSYKELIIIEKLTIIKSIYIQHYQLNV